MVKCREDTSSDSASAAPVIRKRDWQHRDKMDRSFTVPVPPDLHKKGSRHDVLSDKMYAYAVQSFEMKIPRHEPLQSGKFESSFVESFILPRRRERYLSLLSTREGRKKLKRRFAHFSDLDPRFAFLIPPRAQRPAEIERSLSERNAPPKCYVWSDSSPLDGCMVDLPVALSQTVGYAPGTILLCIPGRLAYYEGEEKNQRYILSR